MDHLVVQGVDASRLTARGDGSTQPVADNATPAGRARNRRVEIRPRQRVSVAGGGTVTPQKAS